MFFPFQCVLFALYVCCGTTHWGSVFSGAGLLFQAVFSALRVKHPNFLFVIVFVFIVLYCAFTAPSPFFKPLFVR